MKLRRGVLVSLLLVGSSLLTLAAAQAPPSGAPSEAKRVGSEACKDCHEDRFKEFQASSHGRAEKDGAVLPANMDCETCHGPASLHVAAAGDKTDPGFASILNPAKMPAKSVNGTCVTCHRTGEQFYWEHSAHARKGVSCVQCHSMHGAKDHRQQLKSAVKSEICLSCHKSKKLTVNKSAHMPLREGGMECTSCHNPHGTATNNMLRAASNTELCESCHADKRGPFLWEHAPVRENCATCHEPHGANNDKVLTGKRPFLCQRCHVMSGHPSTLYDGPDLASNRIVNRSCTNCHSQIHGSNHASGRFFTR
jgi:DmsE family decaheme c-type cytochrome